MFYSQVKLSFNIQPELGQNWDQARSEYFNFVFFWMNDDYIVIEYIIDYFILIQTPLQVFESTTVRAIRKYKFKKMLVWTSYFDAFDITTSSGE